MSSHSGSPRSFPISTGASRASCYEPATVSDRSDGKLAHLDGVNLSRAWCMRALGGDALREPPSANIEAALPHVAGDYMGEHWLASFAVLALGPL